MIICLKIQKRIIITCTNCTENYLSVLLSRRSVTTGRIDVHKSSVIVSLFSIRTLAISAETCSNENSYNHHNAEYSVYKEELPSTDRMITHLLHRRDSTPDVISIPHLLNNLQINKNHRFWENKCFTLQSNTMKYKDYRTTLLCMHKQTAFQVVLLIKPYCNCKHHSIKQTILSSITSTIFILSN
jgi:hypothetical protein